ncbi:prephenate dehydrogenase/arogenate dehydrogenase family protein [Streptomyces sp. AC602_WCS936]|uniref:prephenate dehydrogenase/arogenate dehydrogenase family protein n=1 Tax=Streptomyces sp. AC602_WCS936 TaxID=2823685 RepID=UPI001C2758D0|nr:prephenate dehydrogenase/arogenate dehydrogenase family protein [Streptomyces sp. AC602_WCS936]
MADAHTGSTPSAPGASFARCVVAGASGGVGGMFTGLLLRSGAEVTRVDLTVRQGGGPGVRDVADDIRAPGPTTARAVADADLVLLAVPEQVALDAVAPLAGLMRPGALLADTLSVKSRMADRLRTTAPQVQAVGVNPMFAPSLPLPGRPVAAVTVTDGPAARAFLELVAGWGGRVVELDPGEHDTLTAVQQAATHAAVLSFGLVLAELRPDMAALRASAPPPHRTLLMLLARIASGSPEVYWDVQAGNPHADTARRALGRGLERVGRAVADGDEAAFEALVKELRTALGDPHRDELARACADLFTALP